MLVALIRGLARRTVDDDRQLLGRSVRSTIYILLPLSVVLAIVLVSQGVIQNLKPYETVEVLQPIAGAEGEKLATQTWRWGRPHRKSRSNSWAPTAAGFSTSTRRIRLKTRRRSPTSWKCCRILVIPAALCYTFGVMVGDTRQGWAVLAAMLVIFVPLVVGAIAAEQ